jgi:hypothetical protein
LRNAGSAAAASKADEPRRHQATGVAWAAQDAHDQRLRPALRTLLERAVAEGEVRPDVDADDILSAVASLCMSTRDDRPGHAGRMVALLVDGLRNGANPAVDTPS